MRARWGVALVLVTLAAGCSSSNSPGSLATTTITGASTSAPASVESPDALFSRARQAALAKGWAHLEIRAMSPVHTITFSQDSGPDTGRQIITVDGAHATAMLIGGVAYIQGDAAAVVSFFGFPASEQAELTNEWIAIHSTDVRYASTIEGMALSSALDEIGLNDPLALGRATTVGGQPVVGITGAAANGFGTGTVYVNTATGLPVEFNAATPPGASGSESETIDFSAWGTAVVLAAPVPSIADSSLAVR
jgi:hypothetical protein